MSRSNGKKQQRRRDSALIRAIAVAKGVTRLADALGITAPSVSGWDRVPQERVLEIERITGIPRHELRPDRYPPPGVAA